MSAGACVNVCACVVVVVMVVVVVGCVCVCVGGARSKRRVVMFLYLCRVHEGNCDVAVCELLRPTLQ